MKIRTKDNQKINSKNKDGKPNGFIVPIYNIHDGFFSQDKLPQQAYITTVEPGQVKGPHLHFVRTGFFTCIKGNVKVVVKVDGKYEEYFSGEDHQYRSIEIPTGVPAAVQNLSDEQSIILNLPCPAWTPEMNDEHTDDFSDYDFGA